MKNKFDLEFSPIQIKVIDELDILIDSFVTTFTEVGKVIESFSKVISNDFEKLKKEKKNWKINSKKSFDISFMPFLSEYPYDDRFCVDRLNPYFTIAGQKNLIKKIKGEKINDLYISWAFTYDINDNDDCTKFFSLEIIENISNERVFLKKDYINFISKIKKSCNIKEDRFYKFEHTEDKDCEYFTAWLDYKKHPKNVSNFMENCRDLIQKFLSKIKD